MLRHGPARAIVLAATALLLSGCIGIETTVSFGSDGSGTIAMTYRVSQLVTRLGTAEGEEGGVPLPLSAEDFRAAIADAPGVSLVEDVQQRQTEEDVWIEAKLRFGKVEELQKVRGFGSSEATLQRDASGWVYRQLITQGGGDQAAMDAETLQLVDTLFSGYEVTFVVEAPTPIKSANVGKVDGRTARYSIPVKDLLTMTERLVWEVVW